MLGLCVARKFSPKLCVGVCERQRDGTERQKAPSELIKLSFYAFKHTGASLGNTVFTPSHPPCWKLGHMLSVSIPGWGPARCAPFWPCPYHAPPLANCFTSPAATALTVRWRVWSRGCIPALIIHEFVTASRQGWDVPKAVYTKAPPPSSGYRIPYVSALTCPSRAWVSTRMSRDMPHTVPVVGICVGSAGRALLGASGHPYSDLGTALGSLP